MFNFANDAKYTGDDQRMFEGRLSKRESKKKMINYVHS